jgi:hypothetical protein
MHIPLPSFPVVHTMSSHLSDPALDGKVKDTDNDPLGCGNLYLVFEYVEHDLAGLVDVKHKFQTREVKCIAKQVHAHICILLIVYFKSIH